MEGIDVDISEQPVVSKVTAATAPVLVDDDEFPVVNPVLHSDDVNEAEVTICITEITANLKATSSDGLNGGPSNLPALKIAQQFDLGIKVEGKVDEDGLQGAWFSGTVKELRGTHVLVEFDELLSDDGSSKLLDWFPSDPPWNVSVKSSGQLPDESSSEKVETIVRVLRPLSSASAFVPADDPKKEKHALKKGAFVEVLSEDGWWEGIVKSVDGSDLQAYFPGTKSFESAKLEHTRPALKYEDGFWVVNQEQGKLPSQRRVKKRYSLSSKGQRATAPVETKRKKTSARMVPRKVAAKKGVALKARPLNSKKESGKERPVSTTATPPSKGKAKGLTAAVSEKSGAKKGASTGQDKKESAKAKKEAKPAATAAAAATDAAAALSKEKGSLKANKQASKQPAAKLTGLVSGAKEGSTVKSPAKQGELPAAKPAAKGKARLSAGAGDGKQQRKRKEAPLSPVVGIATRNKAMPVSKRTRASSAGKAKK